MSYLLGLGALLSIALLVYLFVCLLAPEKLG